MNEEVTTRCKERSASRFQEILGRGRDWGLETPRVRSTSDQDRSYGVQVLNLRTMSVVVAHMFDADLLFEGGSRLKVGGQVFGVGAPFGFNVGLTGYGHFTIPPNELDKFDRPDSIDVQVSTGPEMYEATFWRAGQFLGVIIGVPLLTIPSDLFIGGGKAGFTLAREWVFVKSYAVDLYLNHEASSRTLSLSDQRYDPGSGAYDGELWRVSDAGNGRFFIIGHVSNLYLNHEVATQRLELTDQKYDPATGAYDGTLWERIYTPHGAMIKSPFAELYLNHRVADRYLGLADQKYNPQTGAYDGTLWRLA